MDKEIEEKFVRTFVGNRMQERIIFELASQKYRGKAIDRFSCPQEIIKAKYIKIKDWNLVEEDILAELKKYCDLNQDVYIMSDTSLDGCTSKLESAVYDVMFEAGISVIVCDEKTAFIKQEFGFQTPEKFILSVKEV